MPAVDYRNTALLGCGTPFEKLVYKMPLSKLNYKGKRLIIINKV